MFSFKDIHKNGQVIVKQSNYRQVHDVAMPSRYDSNFIECYTMPTVSRFRKLEEQLQTFHEQHHQQHVKFIFPENEKLTDELLVYLQQQNYTIGFLELYTIKPSAFQVAVNDAVQVEWVTEANQKDFLQLQYSEDVKYGEAFADEKQSFLRSLLGEPFHHQIIAYVAGEVVGSVELIEQQQTVEIDNLFVVESRQRQGIGGQIQRFVMEAFAEKTVILVADGEDTARDMYQRQGYTYQGFQYEALKVNEKRDG